MAALDDLVTFVKSAVQNIGALNQTLQTAFPRVSSITSGDFTCGASATTTVPQSLVATNSLILLMPTNAAAGTLMGGAKSLYVSARTANTSFAVSTASAAAAAGTETFSYLLVNI